MFRTLETTRANKKTSGLILMAIVSMVMMMTPNHQGTTQRAPSIIMVIMDIVDIRLLLFSLKGALVFL